MYRDDLGWRTLDKLHLLTVVEVIVAYQSRDALPLRHNAFNSGFELESSEHNGLNRMKRHSFKGYGYTGKYIAIGMPMQSQGVQNLSSADNIG